MKMNNYQTLQNWCQIGMVIGSILFALCSYGAYHYGNKKDEANKNNPVDATSAIKDIPKDTAIKTKELSKDTNSAKIGTKGKVKQDIVKQNSSLNAPNALIATQNQSGGSNTINYAGEKFNPANVLQKPILDENGYYGINILSRNITQISKGIAYSFAANIPVNTKLKVTLSKIGDDKRALWGMKLGSAKNWIYKTYNEGEQEFILDEGLGDLFIIFSESGSAKMKIYFNGELLSEKEISWK